MVFLFMILLLPFYANLFIANLSVASLLLRIFYCEAFIANPFIANLVLRIFYCKPFLIFAKLLGFPALFCSSAYGVAASASAISWCRNKSASEPA